MQNFTNNWLVITGVWSQSRNVHANRLSMIQTMQMLTFSEYTEHLYRPVKQDTDNANAYIQRIH